MQVKSILISLILLLSSPAWATYLPGASEAKQDTGNASLSTIASNTTGVATAANQSTANGFLSTLATHALDATVSGSITTQNLTPTGTPTAGSAVEMSVNGTGQFAVQVTGTYTAAGGLSIYGTVNGSDYALFSGPSFLATSQGLYIPNGKIASGGTGIYYLSIPMGITKVSITAAGAVTGTASISMKTSPGAPMLYGTYSTPLLAMTGHSFVTKAYTCAAGGAGTYCVVQIWNPVGSGVTAWMNVYGGWAASGTVGLRYNNAARATLVGNATASVPGFSNSTTELRTEAINSLPSDYLYGPISVGTAFAGTSLLGYATAQYCIPEGYGLEIVQQTANVALNAAGQYFEIPNR